MENQQQTKGFMLVASFSKPYYDAAVMCADSIKDFYPEAKIALYTHKDWFEEKHRHLFDHVHLALLHSFPLECSRFIRQVVLPADECIDVL